MKIFLLFTISILMPTFSKSQSFEGKVTYQSTYNSKVAFLKDSLLTTMMGDKVYLYIRKGDIVSITNGNYHNWTRYSNFFNKVLTKNGNSDTVSVVDASAGGEVVLSESIRKGVLTILGYKCDELTLNFESGKEIYYFNSQLKMNAYSFRNYRLGNFFAYLSKANAIPLKVISEGIQYDGTMTALEIKPMKLEEAIFELPPNSITKEIIK